MLAKQNRTKVWSFFVFLLIFCSSGLPLVTARDIFSLQKILETERDAEHRAAEKDASSDSEFSEDRLEKLGDFLSEVLLTPWPNGVSPLLYVEKDPPLNFDEIDASNLRQTQDATNDYSREENEVRPKRTRYYRKYPWKRQNTRYEPSYVCAPRKEEVFRLLMALHGERNGDKGQFVDFCNRKRPATFVFTNLRFLG